MTKTIFQMVIAVLASMFLASCATMSAEECQVADWREVGQRDGLRGEPLSRVSDHAESCRKAGVEINTRAYKEGRDLGLRGYCQLENAVPLGLSGGNYDGVCPPEIDGFFRMRFQIARNVHDLRAEVLYLNRRTEMLEHRLHETRTEEDKGLKEARSDEERKKIRLSMDDERRDIRRKLEETDHRLRHKRDELRSAEFTLSNLR